MGTEPEDEVTPADSGLAQLSAPTLGLLPARRTLRRQRLRTACTGQEVGEWVVEGGARLGLACKQSYCLRPQAAHPTGCEGPVPSGRAQALRTEYPSQHQEEGLSPSL